MAVAPSLGEQGRRWLVAMVALAFAILRVLRPDLNIDNTTLALVAIAGAILLLPSVATLMRYVKRGKFLGVEVDFREDIQTLYRDVKATAAAVEDAALARPETASDVDAIVNQASNDPRAALLLLSARLERLVAARLREANVEDQPFRGLAARVELGVRRGIFPRQALAAVRDFAAIRNRIAHGEAFDVPDSTVLSVISLGVEMLKYLSVEPMARDGEDTRMADDGAADE